MFTTASDLMTEAGSARPYVAQTVSTEGGLVENRSGLRVDTNALEQASGPIDTLVLTGGYGVFPAARDRVLVDWVAAQAPDTRRVCAICTGAFLLAAAGLLEGRRATTHWRWCARLGEEYPGVRVEPDPIFIRDGDVWTSAGVTAGIDLTLSLVEEDFSPALATDVARRLVVFGRRSGGQSQYSALLALQSADDDDDFHGLHAWMRENIGSDLRIERLAEQAGMGARTFARHYARKIGQTPAKTVEALRLEAARQALEQSAAPIKQIAGRCGFGNEERMRRAFLRRLHVSPSDYRSRFGHANGMTSRPGRRSA
ncbi:MAG: GlxA family transcriptional regulator [Methyloligellaceae bacterium]